MREERLESILITKEGYFFLRREQRKQRGCDPLPTESEERVWKKVLKNADGLYEATRDSFGGGDGTYRGKWWSWDVDTLKKMLDDAGLPWTQGPEVLCVYLW